MELSARFQSDPKNPESPITFSIHCQALGLDTEPFPFSNPLTEKELEELRWYLEDYWRWPVGFFAVGNLFAVKPRY